MSSRFRTVAPKDLDYPRQLAATGFAPTLRVHGQYATNTMVAIVGSRAASADGIQLIEQIAADLSEHRIVIVSGAAIGIDAAAHRGALQAGGPTIAVQGCGLDHWYPSRNRGLLQQISEYGARVSPFADASSPRPWKFVYRNKVIAGLSELVIVGEAELHSGSLHTAQFALNYHRKLGAVPGSRGCEMLLRRGAFPINHSGEVLDVLKTKSLPAPQLRLPLEGSIDAKVLQVLDEDRGATIESISQTLTMSCHEVFLALASLELEALVIALPGQRYVRSKSLECPER